jgi:hypothetical protein
MAKKTAKVTPTAPLKTTATPQKTGVVTALKTAMQSMGGKLKTAQVARFGGGNAPTKAATFARINEGVPTRDKLGFTPKIASRPISVGLRPSVGGAIRTPAPMSAQWGQSKRKGRNPFA